MDAQVPSLSIPGPMRLAELQIQFSESHVNALWDSNNIPSLKLGQVGLWFSRHTCK